MKVLHELIEEVFINGPVSFPSKVQWAPVLGNLDTLRFMVVADQVSGSSLTLTVDLYETPDYTGARSNLVKHLVAATPVVGQANIYQASLADADLTPGSYALSVAYALTGTTPKAHLRIWVTGRGRT